MGSLWYRGEYEYRREGQKEILQRIRPTCDDLRQWDLDNKQCQGGNDGCGPVQDEALHAGHLSKRPKVQHMDTSSYWDRRHRHHRQTEQAEMGRTRAKIHGQQVHNQGNRNGVQDLGNDKEDDQKLDGAATSPATWE